MSAPKLNQSWQHRMMHWSGYPWLVWGLGAAFFFSEYLARLAPNVMVSQLMAQFHLNAWGIGVLSSYFYWPYIIMQLPVGLFVDRYGAHALLMVMTFVCALSCYIFSVSHVVVWVYFARFLLGVAGAFAFVATLKLAAVWFPAHRFGLLAGATQALGMLGAAFGEGPVAMLVSWSDWRFTLLLMSCVFFVLAILIGLFVRDRGEHDSVELTRHAYVDLWRGLRHVLKNKQTWYNALFAALIYAPTGAFAELWGVTYLQHVQNMSHTVSANAMSMVFIGWGIGGPLCGGLSDRIKKRKPFMFGSALLSLLFLAGALYGHFGSDVPVFVCLFMYGLANSGLVIAYALSGEINPQWVVGISIAFANMASVVLAPLFQDLAGWLLVKQWAGTMLNGVPSYTVSAYQWSTVALPLSLILAFFVAFKVEETHCQRIEVRKVG